MKTSSDFAIIKPDRFTKLCGNVVSYPGSELELTPQTGRQVAALKPKTADNGDSSLQNTAFRTVLILVHGVFCGFLKTPYFSYGDIRLVSVLISEPAPGFRTQLIFGMFSCTFPSRDAILSL